ncbi:MAG: peptidoglycan editing factor PgeF [Caldimicrobium sp.]|nr:peptidoglycan editing factor PgeF [Caldimicrobium sp.]MCX7872844.1 peptidoglycan editing factor PgeF [Caldimicrobium sp.]MDW8093577.1 peptidoglycan editing factor PgeF [Caldimicrobium sp.]
MRFHQPEIFKKYNIMGFFSERIPKILVEEGLKKKIYFPKQIHSDRVQILNGLKLCSVEEADGVISLERGVLIGIQSADCVPILIGDKKGRVISAVHAGWRGTLKGILYKTLKKIISLKIHPQDIVISFGPHIQSLCYKVGEEVWGQLDQPFRREPFLITKGGFYYLDLSALNKYQALLCGIPEENLWISLECTHCEDKYHSFRRDKNYTFTQIALIGHEPYVPWDLL